MNYTQLDTPYAIRKLSRYTHNYSSEYCNAFHRLLRYL